MSAKLRHPETATRNPGPIAPPGVVVVPLTQGLFAWIDAEDADKILAHKWYAKYTSSGRQYYAARKVRRGDGKQLLVYLHRVIMDAPGGLVVDHIGGSASTLDNRRSNLRLATNAENQRNRSRLGRNNTSGFRGVSWNKRARRWQVHITVNGRRRHLGLFDTAEDAARAYDRAALELYGEFARTNEQMGLLGPETSDREVVA